MEAADIQSDAALAELYDARADVKGCAVEELGVEIDAGLLGLIRPSDRGMGERPEQGRPLLDRLLPQFAETDRDQIIVVADYAYGDLFTCPALEGRHKLAECQRLSIDARTVHLEARPSGSVGWLLRVL